MELINKIENWCKLLEENSKSIWQERCPVNCGKFTYSKGKKYYKIIENKWGCSYVLAFVDFDGNIYKPDGWKKPSKYIRAHIDNEVLPMNGGDLYAR